MKPTVRDDVLASVVVFLVALPLCMGIAIASGAPVAAGLITGIVGGLLVGWLAGCPLQVSGPAAGLTVIIYDIVQQLGLEMMGLAVLLAGLVQVVAGLMGLGQWFRAVSPAVIKGMLAGIGFLIMGSQFHVMIDDKPQGSGAQNIASIPEAIWKSLALPEFNDRDVRQLRTRALREVGELHRRQVILHEHLSEYFDHDRDASAPQEITPVVPHQALATLADEQKDIADLLEKFVGDLGELARSAGNGKSFEQITESAENALRQNQAALAQLREGELAEAKLKGALPSQAAAINAIETLLSGMKSHHLAAYVGVLTIVLIVLWQGAAPKKLRVVPAPLLAVVAATVAANLLVLPVLYVEVPDNLWDEVRLPTLTVLGNAPWGALWQPALLIAVVASAETLLCATAVDQLHQGPRTRYDRELFAQGVGNTVCGMLGALPMTGVIVRSAANVEAGGKTRASAILHGAWLLLFVVALSFLLRMIPTASLAAMLVYTGYKLVDIKSLRELWRFGYGEVAIYAATVGTIVFTDLLTGVILGIVLSAMKLLHRFSHLTANLKIEEDGRRAVLSLAGAGTFLRLPRLAAALERVPRAAELRIDIAKLGYIDHACLELLKTWSKQHESTGGTLVVDWDALDARF